MAHEIAFSTHKKEELVDITSDVEKIVKSSGVNEGLCVVFALHATAGIIINENADPNVCTDFLKALDKAVPSKAGYLHDKIDGNAAAHIKSAIAGPSQTIIIKNCALQLGRWQSIMFCEFDGPRPARKVAVEIIKKVI